MSIRFNWKLWLTVSMCLVLLAACANADQTEGGSKNAGNEKLPSQEGGASEQTQTNLPQREDPVPEDQPAEVIFQALSGGSEEQFNRTYGDIIRKKFPHYDIKFIQSKEGTRLQDLMITGDRVDIVYNSIEYVMEPLLANGLEYDMTELIKKHQVDLDRFEPSLIEGIKNMADGKMYLFPITNMRQVMFYNKDIFDSLGVDEPVNGMTWEETTDLARKLTRSDGDHNYFGLSASPAHILRTNQLSQPYLDPATLKPTFLDDTWQQLFQTYFMSYSQYDSYIKRIKEKGWILYYTEMTNSNELAMFIFNSQFPWDGAEYIKNIEWDLVSMPRLKDAPGVGSQSSPMSIAITSIAKDKDAAMRIIKALTSDEIQMDYSKNGIMPVLKSEEIKKAYGTESIYKDKNWSAVFYDAFAPLSYKSVHELAIEGMYQTDVVRMMTGEVDVNTFLRELNEKVERYLAEINSQ